MTFYVDGAGSIFYICTGKESNLWLKKMKKVFKSLDIWTISNNVHFFCLNQYRKLIQCVPEQMIRYWQKKKKPMRSQEETPRLNSLSLFTKVGLLKPIQAAETLKPADCKVSQPELHSKHSAAASGDRLMNKCVIRRRSVLTVYVLWAAPWKT